MLNSLKQTDILCIYTNTSPVNIKTVIPPGGDIPSVSRADRTPH